MKKKGFTLVELLAVIAILAILVIMALPAVLRMYRQARQNTFVEEVQGVYRQAQTQYVQDAITSLTSTKTYTNCGTPTEEQLLPMTTSKNFHYTVTIDNTGVSTLKASNGSYKYESSGVVSNPSDITATEADNADICG